METILKIEGYNQDDYDGYKVTTTEQEIIVAISSFQCCCENWGSLISNSNSEEFVGAELNDIKLSDSCFNEATIPNLDYGGGVLNVNLETSKGSLQISLYNSHNGYYSHCAIVKSKQLDFEDSL